MSYGDLLVSGGFIGFVVLVVILRFTVGKEQPDRPDGTLL
jgi:hypothetical protein